MLFIRIPGILVLKIPEMLFIKILATLFIKMAGTLFKKIPVTLIVPEPSFPKAQNLGTQRPCMLYIKIPERYS